MDWRAVGLKVGLEIHQQLDTDKLFCRCPSVLEETHDLEFTRRLRPTQSELGEVDRAALEQARKRLTYRYQASRGSSCLVELDEEPPHAISERAVRVGLTVARLLSARPVDEVHVMRKIVVDGSNTTGFQRTALLAQAGRVEAPSGGASIDAICLEEDACRKVSTDERGITYKLDRLGIPLLEIATGPDIRTPEQAREVALAIGQALRATGKVKRGLGTIRQDLNVSIEGGARVEIKGVQELNLLPVAVEREVERQRKLLEIRGRLAERKVLESSLRDLQVDATHLFAKTSAKVVQSATGKGGVVLALRLHGFAGLLGSKKEGWPRLGSELAAHAKARAGVKGIFHTDELPDYGISAEEVNAVRSALQCGPEDAFALVADERSRAAAALEAVRERAIGALLGVPEETREMQDDGTNVYSRPLPGRARMYPETDVPPFPVSRATLAQIEASLPELPEAKIRRLAATYRAVGDEEIRQLVALGWADAFESVATPEAPPERQKLAARAFLQTIPELGKAGVPEDRITPALVAQAFAALSAGRFAKEALPTVLRTMALSGKGADEAAASLGGTLTEEDVRREVRSLLDREAKLLAERGERAVSALMGDAMKALRGRADGALVSRVVREEIAARARR
ncbi:MAG TPA: Glu-tRNA(Gln) amidotransferase subunit GatE [Candidatus Thermoplasmatota archaeon]|nr:Glu-tRNA(Gln) amidotransferase subunit GatE [Candidatus Thermoplasmatota archaeon]